MELNKIREDLRSIRYYYSKKDKMNTLFETVGTNCITELVKKYNEAICKAPLQLYELYVALYVESKTQAAVSEELVYGPEYVQKLNKKLLKYFQEQFAA